MKKLLYFGCLHQTGHYLFQSESQETLSTSKKLEKYLGVKFNEQDIFWKIDGGYTPKKNTAQGNAFLTIVDPFRILAWHDYTIDRRQNSNSAFIGVGYSSFEEIMEDAAIQFKSVLDRQIAPLLLIGEE